MHDKLTVTRSPKVPQEVRYKNVAAMAMEMSVDCYDPVIFMPSLKEVVDSLGITNGTAVRTLSYSEIIERETGLKVVHNGIVLQGQEVHDC